MPSRWSAGSRCRAFSATCFGRPWCCCRFSCCSLSSYSRGPPNRARRAPFAPSSGCGGRLRPCGGRQRRDGLDLDERSVSCQAGNSDGGAGRAIVRSEVAIAHLPKRRQVRTIHQIVVELHDVTEVRTDRGERVFQVLERLHRLQPNIAAELALAVDAELTGDIDDARRRSDLDHVGVAWRPSQRLRIDESNLAHAVLLSALSHAFLCGGSICEVANDVLGDR